MERVNPRFVLFSKPTPNMKKPFKMGNVPTARHKLNSAHVLGSLVIATAVGLLTRSPTLFVLTAGSLIALSINSGEIRFKGRR